MDSTWRVGRHQPRNLYVGDVMVGVMVGPDDTAAALAAEIVRAMNAGPTPARSCADCKHPAGRLHQWVDGAGRVLWLGPTCLRRRRDAAERGTGVQLPIGGGA